MNLQKKSNAQGQDQPSIPKGFNIPFYYSSLCNCGVFYEVDVEKVIPHLEGTGLAPAIFDGKAMVSFNYQLYTGQFDFGSSPTQEVELCILAYPISQANLIPNISFDDYIRGHDQTKLFGNQRVFVPCDSPAAISAGIKLFGEPKFQTTFDVTMPSINSTPAGTNWTFAVMDPEKSKEYIFKCEFEMQGLTPFPGNYSPITEYGKHEGKLIACRWNILQPMDTYFFDSNQNRVKLDFGTSSHAMKKVMEDLIGDTKPSAARSYISAPVAINSRAYYPDEVG
jgi:hypothetical protein